MKLLAIFAITMITGFASFSSAQVDPAGCTDFYKAIGAFRYHRFANSEGKCYMSFSPVDMHPPEYIYRSFLFTSEGVLMVFNSIDYNEYGVSDGARVYQFFPRNQVPTIIDQDDYVTVQSSTAGFAVNMDIAKAKIHSVLGADFKEDPKIYPGNNGGVEFFNVKTLYLDAGYMNGADPTGERGRKSKFIDTKGKTCSVTNRDIYNYDSDGDPKIKFTDAQLKIWLAKKCPQLTVNF